MSISAKELDDAVRAQFDGQFIDAADIVASGPVTLTISGIVPPNTEKDGQKKLIDKTIIAFSGAKKRMVACNTNLKILTMHFGKKASEWIGKRVTITPRILAESFGEKNVPCVRFALPDGKTCPARMRKHFGEPLARPESVKPKVSLENDIAAKISAGLKTATAYDMDEIYEAINRVEDGKTREALLAEYEARRQSLVLSGA